LLEEQGLIRIFKERLNLPIETPTPTDLMSKWRDLNARFVS